MFLAYYTVAADQPKIQWELIRCEAHLRGGLTPIRTPDVKRE
jgi:hypothetical protein